ncbi:MAG: isocitrate/isopropylmalate dehydrogenase family protein [Alphaproteobacteria bacterium]|nr:isocitrate/isopropylmalate dehydrogenase family protein [Alphaproteobacteria bacterium]
MADKAPRIVVLPGDGIGAEVMDSALTVLGAVRAQIPGAALNLVHLDAGAGTYLKTGSALPDDVIEAIKGADGVLLGAMGLPDVRYPDGTEIIPQIELRMIFGLYAGVRPIRLLPGAPTPLGDARAKQLDFVIIRESTEGLFAHMNEGTLEGDAVAEDRLVITRATSERLFDFSFRLAQQRRVSGHPGKVTLVDKANVFKSMAFFRKIFDERAVAYPEITTDRQYVDAAALNFVRNPWDYDVVVTENMFGDILSDLGAGLIGGMGMAPSADIGDTTAVFQPSHGTAPDIACTGKANPTAMILSLVLLLEWLATQEAGAAFGEAAALIDAAVATAYAGGALVPYEAGGSDGTEAILTRVLENL